MNKGTVFGIIFTVLGAILGALLPKLRELTQKTPTKLDDIALDVVVYVNSLFNGDSGESKKQRAKDLIEAKLGQTVKEQVLDKAVEKAVTTMKVAEAQKKSLDEVGTKGE
jgi:hypothetical protein|nr:MAG TPA: holin [Caudoviricetes sp.]